MPARSQNSCVSCARRKVKCDRLRPCSNCSKTPGECVYRAPAPSQRHRKRLTQGDLLSKIGELEALLHNHSIPFNPLCDTWITSNWEEKLIESPYIHINLVRSVELSTEAQPHDAAQNSENQSQEVGSEGQHKVAQLWLELSEDLKSPMISQLRPSNNKDMGEQLTCAGIPLVTPPLLISTHLSVSVRQEQLELHPDPKHVFKLWQAFADNVNPLTKIIHAPTLQARILEAAWAVESATKPLEATMFAVYALSITSMKPADCVNVFGIDKPVLVNRYRTGALRALSEADLLSTRDLEVLQALALVLMIDHQSELSTTLVALAMRIAHKMGLHRAGENSHISFFEQEMQIRLWWYIRGLNSRVRRAMGLLSTVDDLGDVRLPMNVNDADLHPLMTNPPIVQHTAATEMVYCLMKYDLWKFVRKSSNFSNTPNPRENAAQLVVSTDLESMAKKRKVLAEVENMLEEKYLRHLDPSIPLHQLSAALAGLTIHNQRFRMFHPRHQPEEGRCMSQGDQDLVFESSVRLLDLDDQVRNTNFSTNLVDHMTCQTQVEALVYMVSELRHRTTGSLVNTAWNLLEKLHDEEQGILKGDHKFYTALADLILEAWDARCRVLEPQEEAIPKFIEILQASRGRTGPMIIPSENVGSLPFDFTVDPALIEPLDWTYWNDLLQL